MPCFGTKFGKKHLWNFAEKHSIGEADRSASDRIELPFEGRIRCSNANCFVLTNDDIANPRRDPSTVPAGVLLNKRTLQ